MFPGRSSTLPPERPDTAFCRTSFVTNWERNGRVGQLCRTSLEMVKENEPGHKHWPDLRYDNTTRWGSTQFSRSSLLNKQCHCANLITQTKSARMSENMISLTSWLQLQRQIEPCIWHDKIFRYVQPTAIEFISLHKWPWIENIRDKFFPIEKTEGREVIHKSGLLEQKTGNLLKKALYERR